MNPFKSLHGKMVFSYCLLGGLFISFAAAALLQFHSLEVQLEDQRSVSLFYDAVRHARRLEKNFLLYRKQEDLNEAVAKAETAALAFARLPATTLATVANTGDHRSVEKYRDLLTEMRGLNRHQRVSQEIVDELFVIGKTVLTLGEQLDKIAQHQLNLAVASHRRDLRSAIWAAFLVATLAGLAVTRSVVRPLRKLEEGLLRVAKGESGRVEKQDDDSEMASLTQSINDTLREIESRQQALSRSSRLVALGTMLSGVAHELNNPLSNISSSCQILQEEIDEVTPEKMHRVLGQIDGQVLRAKRIVSALLDFARDRAFMRQREAVAPLVDEALLLMRNQLPDRVRVRLDIQPDLSIDVDHQRFSQVLVNLIKNAVESIPGDGQLSIVAFRETLPEGPGTVVAVEDDGLGIPPENQHRIFDPFFTTKAVGQGTGLGLFVVHEIIEKHGGTLSVDSTPGAGALFRVHIPDQNAGELAHA